MAKRNFEKMIEDGKRLSQMTNIELRSDEIIRLRDLSEGSLFDLIEMSFCAGLAAGYRAKKKEEKNPQVEG